MNMLVIWGKLSSPGFQNKEVLVSNSYTWLGGKIK